MLNRILQENCRVSAPRTALIFGNQTYTYAQLEERVARCAAGLRRLGTAPEKGVVLVLRNSPEFVFAFLAALRLGIPAFLLDSGCTTSELRRVFDENQVAAAVCEPGQVSSLEQIREHTGQQFCILPRGGAFEGLMVEGTEPPPSRVYDAEIAIVQYTSGTTGVSKCIARSHRNLFCEALDFNETTGVSADDRILCMIPLFHAHGLMNAFVAALYAGATLVLMEEFNRAEAVSVLARERITIFPAVPVMFDLLSRRAMKESNSLRLVFSAGAALSPAVAGEFKKAFGIYVRQLYGTTELGSAAINLNPDLPDSCSSDPNPTGLDSVGLPMENVRIDILREDGSRVGSGEVGEVAIQSPAMPDGYFRQPELTRQKFRQGYFWPGDYGRKDTDGYLYIEGRAEWIVSSSGRKVDPREVEAVIATFPKVREVVVVGVPGYLGEQAVKAVVVAREACHQRDILAFCRERLSDFKIPRIVEFVPEIPRSASGKILRKYLVS
jgi:long-chain acyl-CoA synthetase